MKRLFKLIWFVAKQIDVLLMSFGLVLIFAVFVQPKWDYVQYFPEILKHKDLVIEDVGLLLQIVALVLFFSLCKLFSNFNIKLTRVEKRYEETAQLNSKRIKRKILEEKLEEND